MRSAPRWWLKLSWWTMRVAGRWCCLRRLLGPFVMLRYQVLVVKFAKLFFLP